MRKIFTVTFLFLSGIGLLRASGDNGLGNNKVNVINRMICQPGDEIDIKVSPNPAIDYFTVTSNISYTRIVLYNIIGKPLKTYRPEIDSHYELSDLPGGIYILRFFGESNQVIKTIKLYKKS